MGGAGPLCIFGAIQDAVGGHDYIDIIVFMLLAMLIVGICLICMALYNV